MKTYYIEGRYPTWARWRKLMPKPHGERFPIGKTGEIRFKDRDKAEFALIEIALANTGEYRIIEEEI